MGALIDITLLSLLVITALAIVRLNSLFAIVMLFGIYSLLSAMIFVVLDAVDVAFTEAAVGTGISTVLMFGTMVIVGHREKQSTHFYLIPFIVVVFYGTALLWASFDMPAFGDPANPVHQHVAPHYIKQSYEEIGIPNVVTSVLASYRGYDTLGEVIVIFTALVGVMSLLGLPRLDTPWIPTRVVSGPILKIAAISLMPFIILFAFYIQFHGDYGPGGGFQAGVIFCAAIALYTLTFGLRRAMNLIFPQWLLVAAASGVLLYGGTGVAAMILGGNFLDYSVLSHHPVHGQHLGIMLIEMGVGITVASSLLLIFFTITEKTHNKLSTQIRKQL